MKVKVFNREGKLVGPIETAPVVKTDAEWRAQLGRTIGRLFVTKPFGCQVIACRRFRRSGTDAPYPGIFLFNSGFLCFDRLSV